MNKKSIEEVCNRLLFKFIVGIREDGIFLGKKREAATRGEKSEIR